MRFTSVKRLAGVATAVCLSCALSVSGASAQAAGAYSDVPDSAWYADSVEFVSQEGLFTGLPGGRFNPSGTMDRAMLSTVLQRLADGAGLAGSADFTDVAEDAWYAGGVSWAAANGVMTGSSRTQFSPNMTVTREQLATTLYRFAQLLGENTAAAGNLSAYPDAGQVSSWAKDAMSWAVGAGILTGTGSGTLAPGASATRSEVAVILHRCVQQWEKDVKVTGLTALYSPYQKIVALVLEYPENVVAPSVEDFSIVDYENQYYNSANERCDSTTATVTAVYTNNKPEQRADQTSVEGRYVIVELADSNELVYTDGRWNANYAGIANVRYAEGAKEGVTTTNSMVRPDWNNYVVTQTADVVNAAGKVVSTAGRLPAIDPADIVDLTGATDFTTVDFTSSRGNPVYSMLYVPEDYDASQSYPLVVEVSGNSQRAVLGDDGQPLNPGTSVSRDTGAVGWLRVTDDVLILSVQPQVNPTDPDTYNEYEDTYELISHIRSQYNVDSDRIYAIGSSFGTFHLSGVIQRHPDPFAAYIQCNGVFVNAEGEMLTMYNAETDVVGGDYTNTGAYLPESEYYEQYKAVMQGLVDNEMPVWIAHGVNDGSIPVTRGVSVYNMLTRLYKEAGKTQDEIDQLVHLTIYQDQDFLDKGVYNYHDALRLASADTDILTWALEQSKSGEEIVLTKNLPRAEDMFINLDDYYGQVIEGYYNYDCIVSDNVTRTAKFYVPSGVEYNNATVFVAVPDGVDTWDFLVKSGWKDLADENLFYLVAMEPAGGKWGSLEDEVAYMGALNEDVSYRPFFCAFSSNFYGVAYGEAADILLEQSINSPKSWAGIAVLGSSGISASEVSALQQTPSKVSSVMLSQVQTPVWIVAEEKTADVQRLVDFYKSANHSQSDKAAATYADEVYLPQEGGTVDDEWCANVVFDAADWENCLSKTYSGNIYDELFKGVYRYPGDANGALRRPGDIYERGFEKFEAQVAGGYEADGSDLYNREWYVYVPDSVDTSKPAPLVFVFHGAGGSGNEIADRSGWAKVAEEKGLILVCPTGSHTLSVRRVSNLVTSELFRAVWNYGDATAEQPSDIQFVEYLYNWMCENYNIDTSRVYASGQSAGGGMTYTCAAYLPDLFAAAAPVSALVDVPSNAPDSQIPILSFIGEADNSNKGAFGAEKAQKLVDYWCARNDTVEQWDDYTYMDGGQNCSSQEDLFTNYMFYNADGVPMLRCVEVATKTHAIWPSECFEAWNEWFTHFTKDPATGTLYYDGAAVNAN